MQSLASPSTSYVAPAVISLGEEYTDDMLSSEPTPTYDDGYYYSSSSDSETDGEDSDECEDSSPRHHHRRSSIAPSLWQAEHARLLSLQTAVLDNERAAWSREKRLESEVARIKSHLARLQRKQQQQQPQRTDNTTQPLESPSRSLASNQGTSATSPPSSSSTQIPPRCAGPRGPRPKPQQQQQQHQHRSTAQTISSNESASAPMLLPKFSFESLKESQQPKPEEQAAVSVLSIHLTEARSLRAQERQRRRNENERLRELATLLTLGSEVRKWEERLAWSQIQSNTRAAASDDSHLNKESVTKTNNDTDADPRGKRLSRSSSLPSNRMSYLPPPPPPQTTSRPPLSPALPSLALSPLWKVSAEMILRRRQLSERPRRTPPTALVMGTTPSDRKPSAASSIAVPGSVPAAASAPAQVPTSTLARPAHTLRGPREKRTVSSTSPIPSSPTLTFSSGSTSATSNSLSAKRNSIPPPISIPASASFCTTKAVPAIPAAAAAPSAARLGVPISTPFGSCSFFISKTTPVKPSTLKWAFTAADLAREMQAEEEELRQKEISLKLLCCGVHSSSGESSEGESGSDDSCKSSSDGSAHSSSSSSGQESASSGNVERRGRARFSWRKSIPKEGCATTASMELPPLLPTLSAGVGT